MIVIGSDHAGYHLKEVIRQALTEKKVEMTDAGCFGPESVDYPDFGMKAAEMVSSGRADKGILVCGSGIGMSIVANKFPGVRAALCFDEEVARMCRLHNDSNILVLPGRWMSDKQGLAAVSVWLETPFEGGRHANRLGKIADLETRLYKK